MLVRVHVHTVKKRSEHGHFDVEYGRTYHLDIEQSGAAVLLQALRTNEFEGSRLGVYVDINVKGYMPVEVIVPGLLTDRLNAEFNSVISDITSRYRYVGLAINE